MTSGNDRGSAALFIRRCMPLLILLLLIISASPAFAEEELEVINRPVNMSGLTGLVFTTTPYTLPPRTVEIAMALISENSTTPDFLLNEMPAISVSAGIAHHMEVSVKSSYYRLKEDDQQSKRGRGDLELSYKWNFLQQSEDNLYPAVALIITGIAATGEQKLNIGNVAHWGARCGLSIGREVTWSDHVLGAYIDGELAFRDLSDDRYKDRYGILNIGLLYPISKYRNLQLFIEYNLVSGIDKISDVGGDYTGSTFGLRMVSERFNLTIGAQFLRKDVEGFENSSRILGMTSAKF